METIKNKPVETIRDGALSAAIWKNESDQGVFYTVQLRRAYQDKNGNYQDSDSFSGHELLRIAYLASKAHERILALGNGKRAAV